MGHRQGQGTGQVPKKLSLAPTWSTKPLPPSGPISQGVPEAALPGTTAQSLPLGLVLGLGQQGFMSQQALMGHSLRTSVTQGG